MKLAQLTLLTVIGAGRHPAFVPPPVAGPPHLDPLAFELAHFRLGGGRTLASSVPCHGSRGLTASVPCHAGPTRGEPLAKLRRVDAGEEAVCASYRVAEGQSLLCEPV